MGVRYEPVICLTELTGGGHYDSLSRYAPEESNYLQTTFGGVPGRSASRRHR